MIEVTDGEEQNIAALSRAICNGKMSWTQTHIIPLATQEDEKRTEGATGQTDRRSLHFQTTDVAPTGLYKWHKYNICNQTFSLI